MNSKWQKIINLLTLLLVAICFVKIVSLQNDIQNLKNNVNNAESMLQSSINSISSSVRYEMEQANNLISDSGWNTYSLNVEDKTATLHCYVVPKVYNPDKTVANIMHNGNEVPMALENGRYVTEIDVPLFENCIIENVQFKEDGTIRTQQLNWSINPRYDMVPTLYANFSGESRQNYEGDKITRTYKGDVEIDFEHKGFVKELGEIEVVLLVNGKEQWRHKPVLEEAYKDEYVTIYMADLEYSFDLKRGDTVKMYTEVVDENGWKYLNILEDCTISEKGNPIHNREHYHADAEIYDTDGNLLFNPYGH